MHFYLPLHPHCTGTRFLVVPEHHLGVFGPLSVLHLRGSFGRHHWFGFCGPKIRRLKVLTLSYLQTTHNGSPDTTKRYHRGPLSLLQVIGSTVNRDSSQSISPVTETGLLHCGYLLVWVPYPRHPGYTSYHPKPQSGFVEGQPSTKRI